MKNWFGGSPQPQQQQQYPQPNYNQPKPTMQYSGPPIQLQTIQKKNENKCRQLSQLITNLDKQAGEIYAKMKQSKGSSKQMYKNRCTQILKKRKMYEQQLKTYMSQNNVLDQVGFTQQNIKNTIQMGQVMQQTVEAQKNLMKNVDFDKLEDIRDQMEEMKFESDYTNELLNRNFDVGVDDIDLDAEMEAMDSQFYKEVMKNPKNAVYVPNQQAQYGPGINKNSLKN